MKKSLRTDKSALKHRQYAIPYWLQLALLVLLGLTTVSSLYFELQFQLIPPQEGYDPSTLDRAGSIGIALAPVAVFGAIYLLNPRRLQTVPRALESGLLTIAGLVVAYTLNFPLGLLYSLMYPGAENFTLLNVVATGLGAVLWVLFLLIMRATKRWV